MNYYWRLTYGDYKDPKEVLIPPASVDQVKRKMDNGEPIHITGGSIPANQIRDFEITDKLFTTQHLLEGAAQAFHEPIITENGDIAVKWVKKSMPQRLYAKLYNAIPAYRVLSNDGGLVTVAFRVGTHDINFNTVTECTPEEILQLQTRK